MKKGREVVKVTADEVGELKMEDLGEEAPPLLLGAISCSSAIMAVLRRSQLSKYTLLDHHIKNAKDLPGQEAISHQTMVDGTKIVIKTDAKREATTIDVEVEKV